MTDERSNTPENQILPLLFMTTIFLIGFTSRLLLAPLMPAIEKDLMIGHDKAGSFFFFVSAGLFISMLLTYKALLGNASFWIMTLLFTLGVTGTLGIFTMLPLYLISERGMERELANNLIGLSRISCIFVPFAAGWITDRLGAKRTLAGIFTLAGFITILLGLAPDSWIVVLLFMQPVFAVCFFPAGFILKELKESMPPTPVSQQPWNRLQLQSSP